MITSYSSEVGFNSLSKRDLLTPINLLSSIIKAVLCSLNNFNAVFLVIPMFCRVIINGFCIPYSKSVAQLSPAFSSPRMFKSI